jgi:hypothetical protein
MPKADFKIQTPWRFREVGFRRGLEGRAAVE